MGNEGRKPLCCVSGGEAEIVEKKSRFIARVGPVGSEEEALAFIAAVRKQNRDARHNCYAYITGDSGENGKYSDDGEPSKTAGLPMLDLMRKRGVVGVCVVVTRYFGGILLGTGGLVRAYSGAAQAALDASTFAEMRRGTVMEYRTDYSLYGKLTRLAEDEGLYMLNQEFEAEASVTLLVPEEKAARVRKAVTEFSAGQLSAVSERETGFCIVEGKPRLSS